MPSTYISIYNSTGQVAIKPNISDYFKLERSRSEMQVGQAVVLLPISYKSLFSTNTDLKVDTQLRIFRSGNLDLNTFWFVQEATEIQDSNGREYLEVRAVDSIGLLARRIIPYDPTDAKADKTGPAGNLMKAFVRENFGALATDTTRNLSTYLTVDPDTSDGATIDVTVQRPTVLAALQETAATSAKQGSYISFDIVCDPTTGTMTFRTFPVYRGNDHRSTSAVPVYIGKNRGNITNTRLSFSTTEEVNYVYAFGGSIGAVKIYEERSQADRVIVSPFNRREYVLNDGNEIDLSVLDDHADQYLRQHRAKMAFSGDLVETDNFTYDLNYGYGDYLTLDDGNHSFNVRFSGISITDENGEAIKAVLVGDTL